MKKTLPLLSLVLGVLSFLALGSVAMAQVAAPAPTPNMAMFAPMLFGVVALSTQVTTALRDALSAQVPPIWLTLSPKVRPWCAAGVGAVVAFLGALSSAEATGGTAMSKAMLITAALAAMTNLGITVPKLIFAESAAKAVGEAAKPPAVG